MSLELRLKQELKKCPRLGIEPTEFRWGTIYLTLAKSAVALTNTYLQTTLGQVVTKLQPFQMAHFNLKHTVDSCLLKIGPKSAHY